MTVIFTLEISRGAKQGKKPLAIYSVVDRVLYQDITRYVKFWRQREAGRNCRRGGNTRYWICMNKAEENGDFCKDSQYLRYLLRI